MGRVRSDPDIVTRETNTLTNRTSCFIDDVLEHYLASDGANQPRSTRNREPQYALKKTHNTLSRKRNTPVTDHISVIAKVDRSPRLTWQRKEIITNFIREVRTNPSEYGSIGSNRWVGKLHERLVSNRSSGQERNAIVTSTDVKNWLKNPSFTEALEELRNGSPKESNAPSPAHVLKGNKRETVSPAAASSNAIATTATAGPSVVVASPSRGENQDRSISTNAMMTKPSTLVKVKKARKEGNKSTAAPIRLERIQCTTPAPRTSRVYSVDVEENIENHVEMPAVSSSIVQVNEQPLQNQNEQITAIPGASGNPPEQEQQQSQSDNQPENNSQNRHQLCIPLNANAISSQNLYNTAVNTLIQTLQSQTGTLINAYNSMLQLGYNDPNLEVLGLQLSCMQALANRLGNR